MHPESLSLTVLIPTYNRAHLLARAVRSALACGLRDGDEILVVDDGSTDQTRDVVAGFGPPVRLVEAAHGGAGAARNVGLRHAGGALIAFLDSDDEWMPDKLQLQRTFMEARPNVLFSFSNFARKDEHGVEPNGLWHWHKDPRPWDQILGPGTPYSRIAPLPAGRPDFRVHVGSIYLGEMESDYVATTTCMVRRREAGDALRFADDIRISEDKECFGRLAGAGQAAYLDCETSYQWTHFGPRVTDAGVYDLVCARLKLMERIWGRDDAFMARHGDAYARKWREQVLLKSRWLLVRGRSPEARAELAQIAGSPWEYRALALLPGGVARALLGLRRGLLRGG
jgi:glycosyltransferase involved in cell wall biosynthesis